MILRRQVLTLGSPCGGWAAQGAPTAGLVERQSAYRTTGCCHRARFDVDLHEQGRHGCSFKARCTGIPGVREVSMRPCVSRFDWQAHKAVYGQTRLRVLRRSTCSLCAVELHIMPICGSLHLQPVCSRRYPICSRLSASRRPTVRIFRSTGENVHQEDLARRTPGARTSRRRGAAPKQSLRQKYRQTSPTRARRHIGQDHIVSHSGLSRGHR